MCVDLCRVNNSWWSSFTLFRCCFAPTLVAPPGAHLLARWSLMRPPPVGFAAVLLMSPAGTTVTNVSMAISRKSRQLIWLNHVIIRAVKTTKRDLHRTISSRIVSRVRTVSGHYLEIDDDLSGRGSFFHTPRLSLVTLVDPNLATGPRINTLKAGTDVLGSSPLQSLNLLRRMRGNGQLPFCSVSYKVSISCDHQARG